MSALPQYRTTRAEKSRPPARKQQVVSIAQGSGLKWRGPDYPVLPAGKYTVCGCKTQGPEWLRNFRRWSLRVEFVLVGEPVQVSAFFNLGSDPSGPRIGRQSRYYKAWVLANGEHPRKHQEMSASVFLDGQLFEVEVEDSNRTAEGEPKAGAEVYSIVGKILSVTPR